MMIQKVIEQIGYSPNEAKVYIASLQLGAAHISAIASTAKLPRSNAQVCADKLHKNGLMNFYVQRRYKFWVSENPEKLLYQLEEHRKNVEAAIPRLSALQNGSKSDIAATIVKVFTDYSKAKFIFDDILAEKRPLLVIFPRDCFFDVFAKQLVWRNFEKSRVERNLHMRALAVATEQGEALLDNQEENLRRVWLLPSGMHIKTATFIYGNKVALILCNGTKPTSLLIEDSSMSETQAELFEELWAHSTVGKNK